jgi:hypothetical protein
LVLLQLFRKTKKLAQRERWKCLLALFSSKVERIIGFCCRSEKARKEGAAPYVYAIFARMRVPKFVCEVICAAVSASFMDGDVPWDTRSITQKARPSSITLEKGNLGTH